MSVPAGEKSEWAFFSDVLVIAVLDGEGTVLRWSSAAADLSGLTAAEVCGRPVRELFEDLPGWLPGATEGHAGIPTIGRTRLQHRSGGSIEIAFRVLRLEASSELLVLAAPVRCVTEWNQSLSVLRALLSQDRVEIGIHDTDLVTVRTNESLETTGLPPLCPGRRLAEVTHAESAEAMLRVVLESGEPMVGREQPMRSLRSPGREWTLSLSFRLEDAQGRPTGVVTQFMDVATQQRAHRDLDLLHATAARIGGSLDVTRTAQDLAEVLVPEFGDLVWVDLAEAVLEGDEPPKMLGGGQTHLLRVAVASTSDPWPADLIQRGERLPVLPDLPHLRELQSGEPFAEDRDGVIAAIGDPRLITLYVPEHGHSLAVAPLFARGLLLGTVGVWRTEHPAPFAAADADLLAEVASRAALSVDNARRYAREHRAAVALQRRLLPHTTIRTAAAETVGAYRPAHGGAEIGGDWFDVIPLPSLQVALVVGDVIGHGLHATATMGRLRTAVHTLADLELDPTELLTHLDDLVQQLADEAEPRHRDGIGATCLYAVYDPVTRRCTLAGAGHPPPILVAPDGTAHPIEIFSGPPLGVGGLPFETITIELEPGSVLALYSDGLIKHGGACDLDVGMRRLVDDLSVRCRTDRELEEVSRTLVADTIDHPPRDDVVLLLARTRTVPDDSVAEWTFAAESTVVAAAREATTRQLADWGLEELAFATELIVSELVTNAIRYAGGPVGLRLIRETVLICEVTDPSNSQPRLRRASWSDEGGRGLFLVAQLTNRWGSRYGREGKTIWTEQLLPVDAQDYRGTGSLGQR
ncbi:SpoIIE family protein phosphatase [Streptomyces cucumeris]|uniref:ATP-binding SpoIIE family protein phosphatase n=1 Tax=Streptomyces cucumeris TaxID=2962890 RepID=UPI003D73862A